MDPTIIEYFGVIRTRSTRNTIQLSARALSKKAAARLVTPLSLSDAFDTAQAFALL